MIQECACKASASILPSPEDPCNDGERLHYDLSRHVSFVLSAFGPLWLQEHAELGGAGRLRKSQISYAVTPVIQISNLVTKAPRPSKHCCGL